MILNTQQLSLPHNLMASSNGMAGISISGSNRDNEYFAKEKGSDVNTPQLGGRGSRVNSRGMSAKITNNQANVLVNQPYQGEIVESESLLESEHDNAQLKETK